MRPIVRTLWLGVLVVALFSLYSHPRVWWQELVSDSAGYWGFVILLALLMRLWRLPWGRGARWGAYALTAVMAEGGVVVALALAVMPYLWSYGGALDISSSQEVAGSVRVLWCRTGSDVEGAKRCRAEVSSSRADIAVVEGEVITDLRDLLPYRIATSPAPGSAGGFVMYSRFAIVDPPIDTLGLAALSGMYVGVQLSDEQRFEVGMVALQDGWSEERFAQNKFSARRLASLVRGSAAPRIVLVSHLGPPFSGIAELFSGQAHVRPVVDDNRGKGIIGFSAWLLRRLLSPSAHGIFVSKGSSAHSVSAGVSPSADIYLVEVDAALGVTAKSGRVDSAPTSDEDSFP